MMWLRFLGSAVLVVGAAIKLAHYGDAIAARTGLGRMLVGAILMAGATSLPELLSAINALALGQPNLAAGDMFGSNMFNMFLLGAFALAYWRVRLLRYVAMRHALTASLAGLLISMALFFILADIDIRIGWVGLDSLVLIGTYLVGIWLLRGDSPMGPPPTDEELREQHVPSLLRAGIGFAAAAAVLVIAAPWLIRSSAEIAVVTGLGASFVGTAMLAVVTSLPELVATLSAGRLGAFDMAIGNLFGSNLFNMLILGLADVFYVQGRFLGDIDRTFVITATLSLLLTMLGLVGNLIRAERRFLAFDVDALLIVVVYGLGLWLLYVRGLGL